MTDFNNFNTAELKTVLKVQGVEVIKTDKKEDLVQKLTDFESKNKSKKISQCADFKTIKVPELRTLLKVYGLDTEGTRDVLIERIQSAAR